MCWCNQCPRSFCRYNENNWYYYKMLNFVRMVCANDSHSAYNWHGFSYVEPCVCMWAGTRKRSENVLLLICMMGACHYYSFNYKPDSHTHRHSQYIIKEVFKYIIRSTLPLFSLPMSAITGSVVSGLNRITWKYRLISEVTCDVGRGGIWVTENTV